MKIYDGKDIILGRLATDVAKAALMGQEVSVVNCEKIIISGKKVNVLKDEKTKRARKGYPLKSAKRVRLSDRYVRKAIRGMLPWRTTRGREAFKRIMCFVGVPENLAGKETVALKKSDVSKLPNLNYMTVGELCQRTSGKTETI